MRLGQRSILLLCTFLVFLAPTLSRAADLELERNLRQDLQRSRTLLSRVERAMLAGESPAGSLADLRELGESIRTGHQALLAQLDARGDRLQGLGATGASRHAAVRENYQRSLSRYLSALAALDEQPATLAAVRELQEILAEILPARKLPIHGSVPYRHLNLPARAPMSEPAIVPAYRGGSADFAGMDLESSPEAPISLPIAELAESLDWNPVLIYEWVKNTIQTEWYWGVMKGAEETLRQRSGNDADQAALLVALFRSAGFPARYVRGVMEFADLESARMLTGLQDPAAIGRLLQRAGIPYAPVVSGGRISNFQIEHVWVEVEIPYDNYRGIMLDGQGPAWLALDTSIKVAGFSGNDPGDTVGTLNLGSMRDSYLATPGTETPLHYLAGQLNDQLAQTDPGLTYEGLLRTRTLNPEQMRIIPAGLQFREIAVTGEYAGLPNELLHRARLVARAKDGTTFFDQTLPVYRLAGQRIAVLYEPETIEDQEIMNAYGGLDNTPSYLIRLRPVLTVNGKRELVGQGGLAAGTELRLTVELIAPGATIPVVNTLVAGYPTLLGLAAHRTAPLTPTPLAQQNAERLLFERAMAYLDQGNRAEEELASLLQLQVARPLPTLVTLGGVLEVVSLLDAPHGFSWQGLYLDADLRVAEPVGGIATAGMSPASLFMQLAGLQHSHLEHRVFEEEFGVESVSTAKLLALAQAESIPLVRLDAANLAATLPTLALPETIAADIANGVNQGYTVTIPETEMAYEDWTGYAYLKENPTTSESGWMLAGEIAGGMTAWGLDRWPEYYKDRLSNPNLDPPNTDPASGYSIQKITATDMQTGKVGTPLEKKLQVMVRDRNNTPVAGAVVTFTAKTGGGKFTNSADTIRVNSDVHGIAEVAYTLGKCTGSCQGAEGNALPQGNPAHLYLDPADAYQTQVGKNIISAALDSGVGITTPFTQYALPGDPVKMEALPGANFSGYVLTWIGFAGVRIMDQYGNPVANVAVDFSVAAPVEKTPCPGNPNRDLRPALLIVNDDSCMQAVPLYGQCGSGAVPGLQSHTTGEASVQVVLGGVPDAEYAITASAAGVPKALDMIVRTYAFGSCDGYSFPWSRIVINSPYSVDGNGNIVNAAKVGGALPMQAKVYWIMEKEQIVSLDYTCENSTYHCEETVVGARAYDIITDFDSESVTFAGQQAVASGEGQEKRFDLMYEVGDSPGQENVVVHADTKKQVRVNKDVCSTECRVEYEILNLYDDIEVEVYAVDITTDPEILVPLNERGNAVCDVKIPFTIQPAEYTSGSTTVVVTKDGRPVAYIPAERQGQGFAEIAAGFQFERDSSYTAQVILNMGSDRVEIRSEEIPLRFDEISVDTITIEDNLYPIPLGGQARSLAATTPAGREVVWSALAWDDEVKAEIDPATGVITVEDGSASGWLTFRAADAQMPCIYKDARVYIGCPACTDNSCVVPGKEFVELSSINVRLNLGMTDGGKSAGDLFIRAEFPSPALATPEQLDLYSLQDVETVRDAGNKLVQILADQSLVDIRVIDGYSYELVFYRSSDLLPDKTPEGRYQVAETATPLTTWRVENPDAAPDQYDTLVLTQLTAGIATKKYTYTWRPDSNTWFLDKGDGAQVTTKESVTDPLTGERTVTETVRTAAGEIASVVQKVYRDYAWGTKLVAEIVDPEGAALATATDYYDETAPQGSVGRIKSIIQPDGGWARYEYDEQGRTTVEIHAWLDAPVTASVSEAQAIYYSYDPVDPNDANSPLDVKQPRTVTKEIEGVIVSRTYHAYRRNGDSSRTEIVEQAATPAASYGATSNPRTTTVYNPSGTGLAGSGKVASVLAPDGTLASYSYEYGTYTPGSNGSRGTFAPGSGKAICKTVSHGTAAHPDGIAFKTTSATTITESYGNTVEQYSSIFTGSGYEVYQWSVHILDEFGRPEKIVHSDGTFTETVWGCCAKDSETDRTGIATAYVYDTMNRPAVTIREGLHGDITTTVTFDAAGRSLAETIESQGLRLFTERKYDAAGRLEYSIDAAGLRTGYEYPDPLVTTVTRPGGATEITTDYPDGRVRSVTGTGVVPQYYQYGVNSDGSQWTKVSIGSPDSPRWEKTTTDMLGRAILSEKPGYTGTITSKNVYDDLGRLARTETTGQAATVFAYDELGNQYRSGLDLDGNVDLDLASLDRITETDTQYILIGSDWWQESNQFVYAKANDASRTRTSTRRSRLTGFGNGLVSESLSIDIHGNQTVATDIVDRASKRTMTTIDYPDAANNQTSVSEYGLVVEETSRSGVHVAYDYDALGRRTGFTDPRTGKASIHYDPAGRVDYVEDAAGNRTWFGYDPATGRKAWEKNALDKYTRYQYNDRDQVTHIWGEATYPVSYEYDDYGQRTRMYTYQGGSDWTSETWPAETGTADVTIWHYNEATGLLTTKEDAAGRKVSYTYTTSNQLRTRTWARTESGSSLVTTYVCDPSTAELTDIDYSDATTDVSFGYDRLGRQGSITDAVGSRNFSYTDALQLETETITGLYNTTITRTYETTGPVGRNKGFTVGSGCTATYGYDPATGRFSTLSWDVGGATGSVNYGYVPDSDLLQGLAFSTGQHTTYGYEPNRNLKTQVKNEFNANLISQYEYSYDPIGRRENVKNSGSAFTASGFNLYGYNDRNELTASNRYLGIDPIDTSQPVESEKRGYVYDNIGNRKQATAWDAANALRLQLTYTANQLNQYNLITGDNGQASEEPSYDDDGNMTGYGAMRYTYDGENRLAVVAPETPADGSKRLEFVYDYMGRRVQKKVYSYDTDDWSLTTASFFLYDGWNMVAELDERDQATASYVWGLDLSQSLQGAGGIGGLLARLDAAGTHTYTYDGNGNVSQLIDNAGAMSAQYEYDPYGNGLKVEGTLADVNSYRFSTKYFDVETGMYYYGYRYYMPELGRWQTRDPLGEKGGINLYGFVGNEPVGSWDYLGKAVRVAYRRMANELSFLWDLGRSGGHVYLVFDEEFDGNTETCCWEQILREMDVQFTSPFTFSFHPEKVVNPESELNRKGVLVTNGSAVDINNIENDIEPYLDELTENWQITNDPCVQAAIFRAALISAGRHNACGSCSDEFGHYSGSYKNCGGWVQYIIEKAGGEWPGELSMGLNAGAGVGGPMYIPGMVFYGASRAIVEMEPVSFNTGGGETALYPGWRFDLY